MAEELQPLVSLGPFKGLDFTSSDAILDSGYATNAIGANCLRIRGALVPERGRIELFDFTSLVGTVNCIVNYIGPQDAAYLIVQGSAGTILYQLSNAKVTVLTNALAFDQAVQYGAVLYTNAGQRYFPQSTQFYDWQYAAPVAFNNVTFTPMSTGGQMAAATYYYLFTRITTMPDGTTSETSVDLNQYALPPTAVIGAGVTTGSVVITPSFPFTGLNDDGTTFTTQIYRQSTLQNTYLLVQNVATNGPFTDTRSDAQLIPHAQLTSNRDQPPVSPTNRGSICIHKNRVWCFVTVQNANTINQPQVQLWYSNVDRPWEFDLTDQVLLLESNIMSTPSNPNYYLSIYGNDPKGLCEVGSILVCFKQRETWAVYGDDASSFIARQLFGIGCVARQSITPAVGGVFWLSENGPYFFDGSAPQYIGEKIRGYLRPVPGTTQNGGTSGVSPYVQQFACGSFSSLTWYLSFPAAGLNGETIAYNSVLGEWVARLPYAPFNSPCIASVPSAPNLYNNGGTEFNSVVASRRSAPGIIDAWFADTNYDLGVPVTFSWDGPLTDSGKPSNEKWFTNLTLYGPIQSGQATVTLAIDPGAPGKAPFVWTVDLSKAPPYITSIPADFRGYNSQLAISVVGVPGQPAPQIWGVEAWGKLSRNLVIPT